MASLSVSLSVPLFLRVQSHFQLPQQLEAHTSEKLISQALNISAQDECPSLSLSAGAPPLESQ